MTAKMFHLGWFLDGSSAQAWGQEWSGNIGTSWMNPTMMLDLARAIERAGFDYILLEDSSYIGDIYGDSMRIYLENALSTPRQDPAVVAGLMSQVTTRLGIIPTLGTYAYPPYLLARLVGTLDQVSNGRIGWNVVTGSSDRSAQNFNMDRMTEHDLRYTIADEYVDVVKRLWRSWEPGAVVADAASGRFADWSKVHAIEHSGPHFRVRGPLNSGPLPQGEAVIAQAGGSTRGRQFAAVHADTIVASVHGVEAMKAYRGDVRRRMAAVGRASDDGKVMFLVSPVVGMSEEEARAKASSRTARKLRAADLWLATLSKVTNIDFGRFPLDEPLGERLLTTNGHQQTLAEFLHQAGDLTLREAAATVGGTACLDLVGTPDQIAGQMCEAMEEVGGDGFLINSDDTSPHYVAEIVDGLVPELQRRGLSRDGYAYEQLRDNLREF